MNNNENSLLSVSIIIMYYSVIDNWLIRSNQRIFIQLQQIIKSLRTFSWWFMDNWLIVFTFAFQYFKCRTNVSYINFWLDFIQDDVIIQIKNIIVLLSISFSLTSIFSYSFFNNKSLYIWNCWTRVKLLSNQLNKMASSILLSKNINLNYKIHIVLIGIFLF